jgi:hypothetical protein
VQIDVNQMAGAGRLVPGSGTMLLRVGATAVGIALRVVEARAGEAWQQLQQLSPQLSLQLSWRIADASTASTGTTGEGGAGERGEEGAGERGEGIVTEGIPLVREPGRLGGGERYFFVCPPDCGGCGRRCYKLYLAGRYFLCRQCSGLAYSTQYETPRDRAYRSAQRRAARLLRRLHADGINAPKKPRALPLDVYARRLEEALRAETLAHDARTQWWQRFVASIEKRYELKKDWVL